ncbi:hypothetical protein ACTXJ9_00765 [Brachybacterium tyrofermentans]|uniref:hypothetical protein n=1 Tax=Brachybacterium tyrofermentans TaxID=47848 RepID=UPI003FD60C84
MSRKITAMVAPALVCGMLALAAPPALAEGRDSDAASTFATTVSLDGTPTDASAASDQVEQLTNYVEATVTVKDQELEFTPDAWQEKPNSELEDYVAEKVSELNDSDAASGLKDGTNPMSVTQEKSYSVAIDPDVAESEGLSTPSRGDAQTKKTTYWKGHIVASGGFVTNYHFDKYATAQVQKWAGLGGGAGLTAGKAIAAKLGISAIPLIGPVLTVVAAGTAVCTNSDGTMDIKMPNWPPVAYCNPFK